MKTRHIRGTTDYLNGLNLPEGMVGIDEEKKALRFYDGVTVGGYEALGTRAVAYSGPGSQLLAAGDLTDGYFGEVTGAELFTYSSIATQVGLSAGGVVNNAESLWLKFALDGRIVYVAKKPVRQAVSWDNINAAGAVTGGATVTKGIDTFNVTLLRGANANPAAASAGYDPAIAHGSEWNRLLYPVHSGTHVDAGNPTNPSTPYGTWANFSDEDLGVHRNFVATDGVWSWCQEASLYNSTGYRVRRGSKGVTWTDYATQGNAQNYSYWRPCLRLIT